MNSIQIPDEMNSLVLGLGTLTGYYPIRKANRSGSLAAFFVCLIGSAGVFFYGLYVTYLAYQKHGPVMISQNLTTPTIIAIIAFLLGVLAGANAYVNWNKAVAVYEKGFAVRDRKGVKSWRWEDVVSLTSAVTRHYTNGVYTGTTHVYTLYNRQNERLVLNDVFTKIEEVAKNIEQSIFPLLYGRAADQYNAGQTLVFGPVAVSKGGIMIGKKTYPWQEVKEVSIHQGILKVSKKDGGWFSGASATAASIPNLRVLLTIINQVVGLKAGK
jgi:hypothetical protein